MVKRTRRDRTLWRGMRCKKSRISEDRLLKMVLEFSTTTKKTRKDKIPRGQEIKFGGRVWKLDSVADGMKPLEWWSLLYSCGRPATWSWMLVYRITESYRCALVYKAFYITWGLFHVYIYVRVTHGAKKNCNNGANSCNKIIIFHDLTVKSVNSAWFCSLANMLTCYVHLLLLRWWCN